MLASGIDLGVVLLGETLQGGVVITDSSGLPKDPTTLPTFRVYGEGQMMANGQGSLAKLDTGVLTAASNANPIVITSAAHGLTTGTKVTISGVGGNTAANGDFIVTVVNANSFSLGSSTGNGPYTSGGAWHVTGLYSLSLSTPGGDGYEAGLTYQALISWAISSTNYATLCPFRVA